MGGFKKGGASKQEGIYTWEDLHMGELTQGRIYTRENSHTEGSTHKENVSDI